MPCGATALGSAPASSTPPSALQVPLIFHGPGVPAGHVVEQPVQLLDLAATLQ